MSYIPLNFFRNTQVFVIFDVKNVVIFSRIDAIHQHNRQTDGRTDGLTPGNGKERAYVQRRAAKTKRQNIGLTQKATRKTNLPSCITYKKKHKNHTHPILYSSTHL